MESLERQSTGMGKEKGSLDQLWDELSTMVTEFLANVELTYTSDRVTIHVSPEPEGGQAKGGKHTSRGVSKWK